LAKRPPSAANAGAGETAGSRRASARRAASLIDRRGCSQALGDVVTDEGSLFDVFSLRFDTMAAISE
jgi:hypothetical protein